MTDLNTLPLPELYADLCAGGLVRRLLELARDEDLGAEWEIGDITSRAFVPGYVRGRAKVVYRNGGYAAGLASLEEMLHIFKADVDFKLHAADGQRLAPGTVAATLEGDMRAILRVERTLLNLLGRLGGIAGRTAMFVEAAAKGGKAGVFDTRKTTPGLRQLEKYAVRCGGGMLHRLGLYDAVMMKDNHLAAVSALPAAKPMPGAADGGTSAVSSGGSSGGLRGERLVSEIRTAVRRAGAEAPRGGLRFIQLEVDDVEQLSAVITAGGCGVDIVLLDNMGFAQLTEAVKMRNAAGSKIKLEASGGITLETIAGVAATGVDRISTGSLTHGATWLDVALDVEEAHAT